MKPYRYARNPYMRKTNSFESIDRYRSLPNHSHVGVSHALLLEDQRSDMATHPAEVASSIVGCQWITHASYHNSQS